MRRNVLQPILQTIAQSRETAHLFREHHPRAGRDRPKPRDRRDVFGAGAAPALLAAATQKRRQARISVARNHGTRTLRAAKLLSTALQSVILGQSLDLCAPFEPPLDDGGVARLQALKTGSYTFELPLRIGAVLGGASAGVLEVLERFARPLGIAFQIADDLLGTLGSSEVTGKPSGSDLREGKRTLLVARALRMATPQDAALLRESLGRRDLLESGVEAAREVLIRSGAATSCREEADRLLRQALAALDGAPVPEPVARTLREIAAYTVRRES